MQSAFFFYLMSTVFSGTKADDIGFYSVSSAGTGLLMLAVGVFFYYFFKRKESRSRPSSSWTINEDVEGIEEEDEDGNHDDDDDNDDDDEDMRFFEGNDFSPRQYQFIRRRSRGKGNFVPRGNYWKEKNYYNQRRNFRQQTNKWKGRGGHYGRRMNRDERPESPDEWPKLQMGHYSAIVIILAVLIGLVVSNVIGSTCACCVGACGVILVIAHAFFFC